MKNDFYIGWMPKAPATVSTTLRKTLIVLTIGIAVSGILLAVAQKRFSTGNFEFGTPTTVHCVYFNDPVPLVRIPHGKDIFGNSAYITVPLVGFGKRGAAGMIEGLEKKLKMPLVQREIQLKGTLLYNDGKLLMQVDSNENPIVGTGPIAGGDLQPEKKSLGEVTIKGEIVDPKCYFGVMKPGIGKPHKDCAIRCILGGVPPVLRVMNKEGIANYYLVAGPNGEKLNEALKNFIAEPVSINASAVQYGDWVVLYTDPKSISYISKRELLLPNLTTESCLAMKH